MKIHEASLIYRLVADGPTEPLDCPARVVRYMQGAFDEDPTVEWFFVILLNRKNHPLGRVVLTKGTAHTSLVHPREAFRAAVLAGSSAVIAVHNHPSGDPDPSSADRAVTRKLRKAGEVMDIQLLDHVIIGDPGYYAFSESGML